MAPVPRERIYDVLRDDDTVDAVGSLSAACGMLRSSGPTTRNGRRRTVNKRDGPNWWVAVWIAGGGALFWLLVILSYGPDS